MEILSTQWPRLQVIASLKKRCQLSLRKKLVCEFAKDPDFCKALRLLAKNIVRKNIPVSAAQCCQLKKHRKLLLALNKRGNSKTIKRKLAKQSGGAIPFLVPIASFLVSELISSLL